MPDTPSTPSRRSSSLQSVQGGSGSKSGGIGPPSARKKVGTEWECVDLLRGGPNPRWRCKSCLTEYTGAPRRIAQHILGAGGVGQIKPCPRPLQEYVTLMTDLMALDAESGRLVKKSKGEDGSAVAGAGSAGGGGGGASTPPGKPRRKPRPSNQSGSSSHANSQDNMFDIFIAKEDFKFCSSHFVAYDGFRERLHGHNYSCSIRLKGEVCEDGYVVDFGVVKKAMRKVCKELNERFLCPMKSDALNITLTGAQQVVMVCQDGATFVLPRDDCALLPLVHSTAEELAHHLFVRLLRDFTLPYLHARGVTDMEVAVAELPRQEATYRGKIPLTEDMIRDPPFRGARRVEGCFRDEDEFPGSNVHYGNPGPGGSMGVLGNGMGGNSGGSLGISNTNQLHQQQAGGYPYGALLGDSGWGGPSSGVSGSTVPGGRMRLGGAAAAALASTGSDIVLPGLRPGSGGVSGSQGFPTGQGTGGGAGLGLGQESPLGSRSM